MGPVVLLVRPGAGLGDVTGLQPPSEFMIDELATAVESKTTIGNGNRCCSPSTPSVIHLDALLRIEVFSVQPVTTSVIVKVRANSPISVGPQCATVSASITPGASGASSAQVRIVIELRSSGDGFVVEMPLMRILSRAGLR